jgi:hypothetical protein
MRREMLWSVGARHRVRRCVITFVSLNAAMMKAGSAIAPSHRLGMAGCRRSSSSAGHDGGH